MGAAGTTSTREAVAERRDEVMRLTRLGYSANEIAVRMWISYRTVQRMRRSAREDLPIGKAPAVWHVVNRQKRNRQRNERRRRKHERDKLTLAA